MTEKNILEKFKKHLIKESIVKSVMYGLAAGCGVYTVVALVTWLCGYAPGQWLALGLGLGVFAICSVAFYFTVFFPNPKRFARKLDSLGLDERVITSMELEGTGSELAALQLADTSRAIVKAHSVLGKAMFGMAVPIAAVIAASSMGVASVGVGVVFGLSLEGVIPFGREVIKPVREKFVAVSFIAEEGGYIVGDDEQLILPGEYCDTVVAVADDGWAFEAWIWTDGSETYENTNPSLSVALADTASPDDGYEFTATFYQVEDGEGGEGGDSGEGGEGDEGDDDQNQPQDGDDDNNDNNNNNDNNDKNDPGKDNKPGGTEPDPNDPQDGASGKYEDNNKIIDGNTPYRDVFDMSYEQAMQYLAESDDIPPELRAMIEAYFGIIS